MTIEPQIRNVNGMVYEVRGKYICVPHFSLITDEKIREALKKCPNGEYAIMVCRKCGSYISSMSDKELEFIDSCKQCSALPM